MLLLLYCFAKLEKYVKNFRWDLSLACQDELGQVMIKLNLQNILKIRSPKYCLGNILVIRNSMGFVNKLYLILLC